MITPDQQQPPRACGRCGKAFTGDKCPTCGPTPGRVAANSYEYKRQLPFFKEYKSARWKKLRAQILALNPMCQAVEQGCQCRYPATVAHHLIDPKEDFSLFWNWQNIVGVCAHHHPGGKPGDQGNVEYVPSKGLFGAIQEHKKPTGNPALSCNLTGLPF